MSLQINAGRASLLSAAGTTNNPIFAWDNRAATAVISTSAPNAAAPVDNVLTGTTYDPFLPATSGVLSNKNITLDFGADYAPEFAAIAAHNLASIGVTTVRVQSSPDNVTYTLVQAINVSTDPCDAAWMTTVTPRRYWRFSIIDVPALAQASIAVVYLGGVLQMPGKIYNGAAPVLTPTEVELQSNVSAGGHLLGSAIVRRGARASFDFAYLPDSFIRGASWKGFATHFAAGKPFFAAWRPTEMQDLYYMWRDGAVPQAQYSASGKLMDVSIEGRVYVG